MYSIFILKYLLSLICFYLYPFFRIILKWFWNCKNIFIAKTLSFYLPLNMYDFFCNFFGTKKLKYFLTDISNISTLTIKLPNKYQKFLLFYDLLKIFYCRYFTEKLLTVLWNDNVSKASVEIIPTFEKFNSIYSNNFFFFSLIFIWQFFYWAIYCLSIISLNIDFLIALS